MAEPGLYGLTNSNRDFTDPFYWGKNQFNSSFPAALCCYMRDHGHKAVYISLKGEQTTISEKSFSFVFGTRLPNDKLKFCFEDEYEPYGDFVNDSLEHIDLVFRKAQSGEAIRPLEIKLTTLPDDETSSLSEADYGSELVVRSPTMRYLALGIAKVANVNVTEVNSIREIFEPICKGIGRDWESARAMLSYRDEIFEALETFLKKFVHLQRPLLMQPIWKTIGKHPELAEHCLDVFVWSDFAIARMVLNSCYGKEKEKKITRPQRAMLRLARFLYEYSVSGKVYQQPIYDGMTYGTLNDKEFSMPGIKTNAYMKCERLLKPTITKHEIKKIVLGGGQKFLSPERRFDSILFFSKELFDE